MDDVKRSGYLKKIKTMKKKFFLLRAESDSGPARLEYYDNEKKWKLGTPPKRIIYLKTCFNINRKLDTKHKFVISLYTKDDCFAISFDGEIELDAWLTTLLELQHGEEWLGINEKPKPNFEHVWEVNVKNKGLGSSKSILGPYRLCLTERTLSLVQMSANEPLVYDFPMVGIRRCGHSEAFFFMEVGRSTTTGPGELWMLTDDTIIAHNMHEVILNAMKKCKGEVIAWTRSRSHSTNDSAKPIATHARRQTVIPSHTATSRDRCDSMPSRSRTVSDGNKEGGGLPRTSPSYDSHSQKALYNRTMSCSPPHSFGSSGSNLGGLGADGGSGSSLPTCDCNVNSDVLLVKDCFFEPSIEEEGSAYTAMSFNESFCSGQEGYMEMHPGRSPTSPHSGRSSLISSSDRSSIISPPSWLPINNSAATSVSQFEDYLDMSSPVVTANVSDTPDGYMPMSPVGSYMATEHVNGGQTKADQTTPEGYVPMAPLGESVSQTMKTFLPPDDEGYMEMEHPSQPPKCENRLEARVDSSSRRSSDSPSTDMCFAEYPLDKVQAYFTPSEDDEPMLRTSSIGSRADCKIKNRLEVATDCRTRAFSVGSNVKRGVLGSKLGHCSIRSKGIAGKLFPVTGETNVGTETVSGSAGGSKKSMSAPVLGTSPLVGNVWQTNGISYANKRRNNEDLMEMDFPESQSSSEHRNSSSSLSGRPLANSKSPHIKISTKADSSLPQSGGQKKATQEPLRKASDYLVMEISSSSHLLPNDTSSGERKRSLPISITESSSTNENRRSSEDSLSVSFGDYVNIDPSRSFEYRSSPSSTISPLAATLSGISYTCHRSTASSAIKFNPEYVNLQYGFQPTKDSILEEKVETKANISSASKNNETDSDYTVMAPGYLVNETAPHGSTSPAVKFSILKSPLASTSDDESQESDGVQRQLNYAALDLPPSSSTSSFDESEAKIKASSPTLSQGSSSINLDDGTPNVSFYAKIDFVKSEGFRSQTQNSSN